MSSQHRHFNSKIRLKADLIINWRLTKDVSQSRAAKMCGIAIETYRAAEGGKLLQALTAARLSRKLGIPLDELRES